MKTIPWSVPNLYELHSNPEKLVGYSDDIVYTPTEEHIGRAEYFYTEWEEWVDEHEYEVDGETHADKWTFDFFLGQIDIELDFFQDSVLDKLSDEQLSNLWTYIGYCTNCSVEGYIEYYK